GMTPLNFWRVMMSQKSTNVSLRYTSDPAHGWLAVPVALLVKLQVERSLSTYSYLNDQRTVAYLEEDRDMGVFMNAARDKGLVVNISERHVARTSIRNMLHYHPRHLPLTLLASAH